jgi:predicted dehydrogenase
MGETAGMLKAIYEDPVAVAESMIQVVEVLIETDDYGQLVEAIADGFEQQMRLADPYDFEDQRALYEHRLRRTASGTVFVGTNHGPPRSRHTFSRSSEWTSMDAVKAGVLGCGTISDAYLSADDRFDAYDIVACADLDRELAKRKADEYGVTAMAPEKMVADPSIEIVVNLTPPSVHEATCRQALEAGTHVYVEKPLAATVEGARNILQIAEREGLLVGSAPDTFLGAGLQTARQVVDDGVIGKPVGATAIWTSPGHETWHPNPDLYYQEGGGPLFDMGPYYVTALVSLLGPATRVAGSVTRASEERTITSESRHGETIDVEVPTHESGVVDFATGAVANLTTSFDVQGSTLPAPAFELYGTEGTLALPDPNHFEGPVRVQRRGEDGFEEIELTHEYTAGRSAGIADLASAIRSDWDHRTSADLAAHVLDVLSGIRQSSESDEHAFLDGDVERPAPLPTAWPGDH